jgi:hypothetical protein
MIYSVQSILPYILIDTFPTPTLFLLATILG